MNDIIYILEFILVFFLASKKCMPILLWVMSIMMFQMSYYYGNERIYLEIIEDYPIKDCIKPKHCKFLFKKLNRLSYKDIPKEMYYGELIQVGGFLIYSVTLMILIFVNEYFAGLIGIIYVGCMCVLSLVTGAIVEKNVFVLVIKN